MDKAFTLKLLFSILLILMYPMTECHWVPRGQREPRPYIPRGPIPMDPTTPLCHSQFTLANRACALVPYISVPPPGPPAPPAEASSRHRHHHRHHHRRHHHHMLWNGIGTPVEEECCRWLKEIDNVCVCNVLAGLPIFLSRPTHNYTVVVGETCMVPFECLPRVMQLRT